MNRFVLLVSLVLAAPAAALADENEDTDEMDFLDNDKAEAYEKAQEADRAPSGDFFLEDDEEDGEVEAPSWVAPGLAIGTDTDVPDEDEDEDLSGPMLDDEDEDEDPSGPMLGDEDEDEDEDPIGDLSVADRAAMMQPLADNFAMSLVSKQRNHVTVELPVLVAQSTADFKGQDYWVIAQVIVNGTPISEGRHLITRSSIAESGPTKVWFKLSAPVRGPESDVEVKISHQATKSNRVKPLFSRSLTIQM